MGGGFETGVAYVLDGADHNNQQENINYALPFPDALQEFRVATSGLTAQNGVKSGAAVNAVTKSGTNRFSGNAFEFARHYRFNATNPFAAIGPDGERTDDGLKRNQFGGTLGGPIVRDKLFFFGAYQGTATRQRPASNIARVPTAQMLTGDLTTFASAQCNGGRPVALRAPYVDNRLNPALLSPAGLSDLRQAAQVDRPVRRDHLRDRERQRRTSDARAHRLPAHVRSLRLRAVLRAEVHQAAGLRRRRRQHPEVVRPGHRRNVARGESGHDVGLRVGDGQQRPVRAQQVDGGQQPEPVLLPDGRRRPELSLLRAGLHGAGRHGRLRPLPGQPDRGALLQRQLQHLGRPDARAGKSPVRVRWERPILGGELPVLVARQRYVAHHRVEHGAGTG